MFYVESGRIASPVGETSVWEAQWISARTAMIVYPSPQTRSSKLKASPILELSAEIRTVE